MGEGKDLRIWDQITLALSPAESRAYTGSFRSEELGLTYTLEATGSGLLVRGTYFGGAEVTIVPFSKDVFVGDLVGIVKFSRNAQGAVTGFSSTAPSPTAFGSIRYGKERLDSRYQNFSYRSMNLL